MVEIKPISLLRWVVLATIMKILIILSIFLLLEVSKKQKLHSIILQWHKEAANYNLMSYRMYYF